MVKQIKIFVESEQVEDFLLELIDIDDIEIQVETQNTEAPDESKIHPSYSLTPGDLTTVLVTLPAIITSLSGLAKVLLDYRLKAAQSKLKSKKNAKEISLVSGDQVIPLSRFSNPEELAKFLEEKTKG